MAAKANARSRQWQQTQMQGQWKEGRNYEAGLETNTEKQITREHASEARACRHLPAPAIVAPRWKSCQDCWRCFASCSTCSSWCCRLSFFARSCFCRFSASCAGGDRAGQRRRRR